MNNKTIANLSFVICAVILLSNITALLIDAEITKTSFIMSIILMIVLLFNGIIHKRKSSK